MEEIIVKKAIVLVSLMLLALPAFAVNEIVVTELMYNSLGTDVEWIELINNTDAPIDLTGWTLVDDLDHNPVPLSGVMGPEEVMVLVVEIDLFSAQYPDVTNYFPAFASDAPWGLNNGGDEIFIFDDTGTEIFHMEYDDGGDWPSEADGDGPSLVVVSTDVSDFSDGANWMPGPDWGTPGVIVGTVATESATMGLVKSLYR